ncbi:unnamed protein product [Urochloa decumbens]|uniref:Uncharacterized protein n=1 Tax=Urochloa decumbens TaxID=240449 RepID=A0ABC8VXD9_9POAL
MMDAVVFGVLLLVLVGGGLTPMATADVFCDNLKQVAATLPKKTSSSTEHFATTAFGQAPDSVYAFALCRGDIIVNDLACGECVAKTFEQMLNVTPPPPDQCQKAAYNLGDDEYCNVLYSTDNKPDYYSTLMRWNPESITGDAHTVGLLHQLLEETIQAAAAASATTPRRFGTGVMDSPMVFYTLAQCTPDMSAGNCSACLNNLLGMINFTMTLPKGERIANNIRCYLRYESYPYYDSRPIVRLRLPPAPAPSPAMTPTTTVVKHKRRMSNFWAIPIVIVPVAAAAFLCFILCSPCPSRTRIKAGSRRPWNLQGEDKLVWQGKDSEFSLFGFEQVLEATDNFSEENKLGQGGFGAVYKGQFPQGLEIAVKRLASHSGQGFTEFENEVQLIAKLQHRNLVRLLGCCTQEEEKILVYEYLPNKSLDFFIFDENKRSLLDWKTRVAIIEGIAHGLLYLHKHSRLCVIHRDLKPSNILLDSEMNPKISDFGLAKIFTSNNTEGTTTRRVVGTYGYMAPEYASEGHFSIKSDVFSFGVLVLEIICGRRNSSGHECGNFINLLGYAWQLYQEGRWGELVDASLVPIHDPAEMMRCTNIALLCVQEKAADRPTMLDVVAVLSSKTMVLVEPKHPAYFNLIRVGKDDASTAARPSSINDMTISITTGR